VPSFLPSNITNFSATMRSLKPNFILGISVPLAAALEDIKVPDKVYANKAFDVEVDNDLWRGTHSADARFDSYRTFLVINTTGSYEEQCYLQSSTSISSITVTVQIPADVGVTGDFYRIGAQPFNQDPRNNKKDDTSTGLLLQSKSFHLEATNDGWAPDTVFVDYANYVPCTSYNGVRKCIQFHYPSNASNPSDPCNLRTSYDCFSKCTECLFPSWEDMYPGSNCTNSTSSSNSQSASPAASTSQGFVATRSAISSTSTSGSGAAATTSTAGPTRASQSSAWCSMAWKETFGLVVAFMLALAAM